MKDEYMAVAEQIARDNYHQEYYDLPDNLQVQCYNVAMSMVHEYICARRGQEILTNPLH